MVRTKNKKGFTLVELLICVAILAVLAAISIPIISGFVDNANDRSDRLMAEIFSSYMTKYANEDPGPVSNYSQLSTSEQPIVKYAGRNYFPGALQSGSGAYASDEEVWSAIRREAIVAMKMYGEEIVTEGDYYIVGPKNTQHNYIYYYLSGKIVAEDLEDVIERTEKNLSDGKDVPDNYWVALDVSAGNAEAVTTTTTGNVYINLYYYGLGIPHSVGELKNDVQNDIYLENTVTHQKFLVCNTDVNDLFYDNNVLEFENVTKGTYQLYINSYMVTNIPSAEYGQLGSFSTSGTITVSDSGYAGATPTHPYRAYVLAVSHGNVSVFYKTATFNNNGKVGTDVKHQFNDYYNLAFSYVPSKTNDQHVTFTEGYSSNNRYVTALYDTARAKYLPFGLYNLVFTADARRNVTAQIESSRYGIYDVGNPNNSSSEFTYEIITRKNVVNLEGTIDFGTGTFPLNSSLTSAERSNLSDTYDVTLSTIGVDTKVWLISTDGQYTYELGVNDLTDEGNGVYSFSIPNVQWDGNGTNYHVYYSNTFHGMNPIKVTTNPTFVEGFDITGDYVVTGYFKTHQITSSKVAISQNVTTNINSDIVFTNIYTGTPYTCTNKGKVNLPSGFYNVSIKYPQPYNVDETVKVLVCDSNLVFNFKRTYDPITLSGVITPTNGGTYISNTSNSFASKLAFPLTYTNVDGTSGTATGSITANGNKANYTITVPLALTYVYSFNNTDSLCFTNVSDTYIATQPSASRSKNYNMERNTSTAEGSHRGTMNYETIDDQSHKVFCNFCTKQLANHTSATEVVVTKATCTANGKKKFVCNTCSRINTEPTIAKRNHNYTSAITTASTCYSTGVRTYTCQNKTATTYYTACTSTYTEDVAKAAHSYSSSWTVTAKATCTANGTKERRCTNYSKCGAATDKGTTIAARGHANWTSGVEMAATCTGKGTTRYYCGRTATTEYTGCSYSYTSQDIPAKGHSWTSSVKITDATCTAAATYKTKCSRCSSTSGSAWSSGSALGHNWDTSAWHYIDSSQCGRKCKRCGVLGNGSGHAGGSYSYNDRTSRHWKTCTFCGGTYASAACTAKNERYYDSGDGSTHHRLCVCGNEIVFSNHTIVTGSVFGETVTFPGGWSKKIQWNYCKYCGYD